MSEQQNGRTKQHEFYLAMERLRRHARLKELEAPIPVLDQAEMLLARSRTLLGEAEWARANAELPAYQAVALKRENLENEWDKRCGNCAHWMGMQPYGEERWCAQYEIGKTTRPEPCPKFAPRGRN